MIWTIFLIIISLFALFLIMVMFTPFGISLQFSHTNDTNRFNAFFFLLSSFFIKIEYDFTANNMIIRLFSRKLDFSKKDHSSREQQDDKIRKRGKGRKGKDEKKKQNDAGAERTGETEVEAGHDELVASSGTTDLNQNKTDVRDNQSQSLPPANTSEALEPQLQEEQKTNEQQAAQEPKQQQSEQKKKKERLTDKINQVKSRINRHPAVFFLKQEKLRYRGWRWVVRILKSILRIIAIRRLLVRTELVFDDPALGGKLFGYYEGVRHAAALYSKKINLYFRPLFIQGETCIDIDFRATTSLWKIGYPLLVTVVTFPYLTFGIVWWRFYKVNRQQKKADEKRN